MKTRMIILAIALAAASQGIVFGQPTTPFTSSTTINGKKTIQFINPFAQTPAKVQSRPRFIGGLSTQPWVKAVGWHPAAPSWAYENGEIHEPQLQLLSVKF